jgi:hypothetical protein
VEAGCGTPPSREDSGGGGCGGEARCGARQFLFERGEQRLALKQAAREVVFVHGPLCCSTSFTCKLHSDPQASPSLASRPSSSRPGLGAMRSSLLFLLSLCLFSLTRASYSSARCSSPASRLRLPLRLTSAGAASIVLAAHSACAQAATGAEATRGDVWDDEPLGPLAVEAEAPSVAPLTATAAALPRRETEGVALRIERVSWPLPLPPLLASSISRAARG